MIEALLGLLSAGPIGALIVVSVLLAAAIFLMIKQRRENGHPPPVDRREHLTSKLLDIIGANATNTEKLAGAIEKLHDTLAAHHQSETLWYERMQREVSQLDQDVRTMLRAGR